MLKIINPDGDNMDVKEVMEYINSYVFLGNTDSYDMFEMLNIKKEMLILLENLNNNYYLNNSPQLVSLRPFTGGIITLVKKIIYRSTRWYFEHITKQQREINASIVRYLNSSMIMIEILKEENSKLKEKLVSSKKE